MRHGLPVPNFQTAVARRSDLTSTPTGCDQTSSFARTFSSARHTFLRLKSRGYRAGRDDHTIQESDEFRALLAGIDSQQAGLSHLDSQRFVRWFLANGYCTTGAIEKLIHNANLRAIAQGGTALTLELLEQAMVDPLPPPLIGEKR